MARIYCDSNVYRVIKPSHPSFNASLLQTMEALRGKLLFVYSDAHLDDLRDSIPSYRDADLLLMDRYVEDNYFYFDHGKEKRLAIFLARPSEAFQSRDFQAIKAIEANPFDFDTLIPDDPTMPEIGMVKDFMKNFLALPLAMWGVQRNPEDWDETTKAFMDKIIPGFHSDISMGDLLQSMTGFTAGLLTDSSILTELRQYIRTFMDRDEYSFERWGLEFDRQFKNLQHTQKSFMETVEDALPDKKNPGFYSRFTTAYSLLEVYNVTQERKSSGGLKKFTYSSLLRDAAHAFYGTFCDYLVTDDKGLQAKAYILYRLFKVDTKIFSTHEFSDNQTLLLGQEETQKTFFEALRYDLKHALVLHESFSFSSNAKLTNLQTTHRYFNFLNELQLIADKERTIVALFSNRHCSEHFVLLRETALLVQKLLAIFGPDTEDRGTYEIQQEKDHANDLDIRKWQLGDYYLHLNFSDTSGGLGLCIAFDQRLVDTYGLVFLQS